MPDLRLLDAPARVWRVERADAELAFSQTSVVDAASAPGNRFDIPGAGVLYTSTSPAGALAETLAQFRPSTSLIERMHATGAGAFPPPGHVEASWFALRRLRGVRLIEPLPFVDVDDPHTHTFLTTHAARELQAIGVDNLDVAIMRGAQRPVTRTISSWLYSRTDESGTPRFSGIRYTSRLGPYKCWAIFEGTRVEIIDDVRIEDHPALDAVLDTFGLSR